MHVKIPNQVIKLAKRKLEKENTSVNIHEDQVDGYYVTATNDDLSPSELSSIIATLSIDTSSAIAKGVTIYKLSVNTSFSLTPSIIEQLK